jgi:hypothetical protein
MYMPATGVVAGDDGLNWVLDEKSVQALDGGCIRALGGCGEDPAELGAQQPQCVEVVPSHRPSQMRAVRHKQAERFRAGQQVMVIISTDVRVHETYR